MIQQLSMVLLSISKIYAPQVTMDTVILQIKGVSFNEMGRYNCCSALKVIFICSILQMNKDPPSKKTIIMIMNSFVL